MFYPKSHVDTVALRRTGKIVRPEYHNRAHEYELVSGGKDHTKPFLFSEQGWLCATGDGWTGIYKELVWMDAGDNEVSRTENGNIPHRPSRILHGECNLVGAGEAVGWIK